MFIFKKIYIVEFNPMIQVKKGNYNKLFKSYIFLMHILIHCFINKKNFEKYLLLSSELIIFRFIYSVIFFFFFRDILIRVSKN